MGLELKIKNEKQKMKNKKVSGKTLFILGFIIICLSYFIYDRSVQGIHTINGAVTIEGKTYVYSIKKYNYTVHDEGFVLNRPQNIVTPRDLVLEYFYMRWNGSREQQLALFTDRALHSRYIDEELKISNKSFVEFQNWDKDRFKKIELVGQIEYDLITAVTYRLILKDPEEEHYGSYLVKSIDGSYFIDEKIKGENKFFQNLSADGYSLLKDI